MPIQLPLDRSQIMSQCFSLQFSIVCCLFSTVEFFLIQRPVFFLGGGVQDKNQQQHPFSASIIQGAAAAFILFDFYQPVPPSGWFFHTFLYFFGGRNFCGKNSNPFLGLEGGLVEKAGKKGSKKVGTSPS